MIIGRRPSDYDIATSALPDQIQAVFPGSRTVGKAFGVILACVDRREMEIATFRKDGVYADGRHPEGVRFSNAKSDAARRDFTINSLFYDPAEKTFLDYCGGMNDIRKRTIRCVGSPRRRFREDHLRMMRAVRLASVLGFRIDRDTENAIRHMSRLITKISPERIRDELLRSLGESPAPTKALRLMRKTQLLDYILPELASSPSRSFSCSLKIMGRLGKASPVEQLAVLFLDQVTPAGAPSSFEDIRRLSDITAGILKRLRFSRNEIFHITMVQHFYWLFRIGKGQIPNDRILDLADGPAGTVLKILRAETVLKLKSAPSRKALAGLRKLREAALNPALTGKDLVKAGIEPGPAMKPMLQKACLMQAQGADRKTILQAILS